MQIDPKRKVLVLGASGLLGNTVVPHLRMAGFDVVAHGNSKTSATDVQCDATDIDRLHELIRAQSPDFIVNLIALTSVDRCNAEIDLAFRLNVKVVENIVATLACSQPSAGRLVHISTDHIYDKGKGTSTEKEVVMRNVYALSKYAGEMAAQRCDSIVLRTNFVGPGRVGARKSFAEEIRDTLAAGANFGGFDDCYFNPLSSEQLSKEIARVLNNWKSGIYNLGATTGLSKYEFARQIALSLGLDVALVKPRSMAAMPSMVDRPLNMLMNVDSFQATFNTKLPTLEFIIKEIAENLIDQQ